MAFGLPSISESLHVHPCRRQDLLEWLIVSFLLTWDLIVLFVHGSLFHAQERSSAIIEKRLLHISQIEDESLETLTSTLMKSQDSHLEGVLVF